MRIPSYDDISDETSDEHDEHEEQQASKSDELTDHTIEESDLEFDFDLDADQEVPDFMTSSASEHKIDSPKLQSDSDHEVPAGSDLENESQGYDSEDGQEVEESEGSVSEDDAEGEGLLERVESIKSQKELDEGDSSNPCSDEHELENELNEKCEEEQNAGATR